MDDECTQEGQRSSGQRVYVCECIFNSRCVCVWEFNCTAILCAYGALCSELGRIPWSDGMFKVQQLSVSVQGAAQATWLKRRHKTQTASAAMIMCNPTSSVNSKAQMKNYRVVLVAEFLLNSWNRTWHVKSTRVICCVPARRCNRLLWCGLQQPKRWVWVKFGLKTDLL